MIVLEKNFTSTLPIMGSKDSNHLVFGTGKTVCDYVFVGTTHPDAYAKAVSEGKRTPFFNHNENYQVDWLPFLWVRKLVQQHCWCCLKSNGCCHGS